MTNKFSCLTFLQGTTNLETNNISANANSQLSFKCHNVEGQCTESHYFIMFIKMLRIKEVHDSAHF